MIASEYFSRPDIQLSGDACFTQSREKDHSGYRDCLHVDAPPRTLCISKEDCDVMKRDMERIKAKAAPTPRADREPGVLVANEVLDLCGESYQAADEKHSKSSKKLFDDTGIMALVCRHDRVLFWVNMTEGGEKQYYMLALLDKLFRELPSNLTVGFLYDIACQLHQSISKVCFHFFNSLHSDVSNSLRSGTFFHSGLIALSGEFLHCMHLAISTHAKLFIIRISSKCLGAMREKALSGFGA